MLDDLFEADNAAAARDLIARPLPPPPKPAKFSAWSAIPRGVAVAAGEVGASLSDIAGAAIAFRDTPSKDMARGGLPVAAFSSELGDSVRDYWRTLKPDPETASTAEQVLFGFSRGLAKLIPATIAAGPAGAIAVGIEEAMTVSDELRRQGVPDGPRQLAGIVQGVGMGSAALPLLGRTLAETAALYVAGGPGGFMAQQALTRKVLENAGQERIAGNYDPFDPIGLTVASAIPLVFTAAGLRGQKLRADAKAQADFIAGPKPSEPTPVAAAVAEAVRAPELSPEVVDAAMVNHLRVADDFLTVWHGSPHSFDAFDSTKIGTGEGAQAYGHGLYLADSPTVAKEYAEKLSNAGLARHTLTQSAGDIDAAIAAAQTSVQNYKALIANGGGGDPRRAQGMLALAEKKLADLTNMKAGTLDEAGNLYKVAIPRSMTERMLDWDKPLSQQAPEVQRLLGFEPGTKDELHAAADALLVKYGPPDKRTPAQEEAFAREYNALNDRLDRLAPDLLGSHYYKETEPDNYLHADLNPQSMAETSEELRKRGIPGIRYLDGGSRANGEGTYNYVIFPGEEGKLRILEANGKPKATPEAPATKAPPAKPAATTAPDPLAKLNEPADAPPKPLAPPIQDALSARVAELDPELVVRVDPEGRHVTLADDLAEVRRLAAEGTDDALGTLDADLLQVAVNCALSSGG